MGGGEGGEGEAMRGGDAVRIKESCSELSKGEASGELCFLSLAST